MHATKTPIKNPTNPLNVRYIKGHEIRKAVEKNGIWIFEKEPIMTVNANGKKIPLQSHVLAKECINRYFLEGRGLREEEIENYSRNYHEATGNIGKSRAIFRQSGSDLRVAFYDRCMSGMIGVLGRSFKTGKFEKLIIKQDADANLTWLEMQAEPGKNPRMGMKPIIYSRQAVDMFFYLMDVAREFKIKEEGKKKFKPIDFKPVVPTFDLGSYLCSGLMAFGTRYYYSFHKNWRNFLYELPNDYKLIVALQRFESNQALAIAYYVAGTLILRSIKKTDTLAVIEEKLEAAHECFSCALRIKHDYADAIEGKAYVFMLMKKGDLSSDLYGFANEVRQKLEKEYAAFKQEHASPIS